MVDFVRRRLQVFISSTFSDLKTERQAAVEAILSAGHIPAGMELFTAGDESQMEVIKQWIDESDVYLLILGGRYGSIEPRTGKSYTQLEYEYALNLNKAFFACVVNESAIDERVKLHGSGSIEKENPHKLKEFRKDVLGHLVKFWDDPKDIKIAIGETLSQLSRREDLTGWVRPSRTADMPALADEIARLSKENAELRKLTETKQSDNFNQDLSFDQMKRLLKARKLLAFLYNHRFDLGSNSDGMYEEEKDLEKLSGLYLLGLVQSREVRFGVVMYRLTDAGRTFLNRYQLQRLASEKR